MASEPPAVIRYLRRVLDDPAARGVADADLLQRFVAARDEAAFELLLWRHSALVMGVCRAVLRDRHLAEDAFQATFLALARKVPSVGRREALAGWLYRVAYHAALKARARAARTPAAVEPDSLPAPERTETEAHELTPLLHEELGRLPAKYRTPLVLCYLQGQTHADAARQLGWPKGTVSGRLARGRDLLRRRLLKRGVTLTAGLLAAGLATGTTATAALVAATARAGADLASGAATSAVSAQVLRLTEGVLRTMFLSKVKTALAVGVVLGCLALGGGLLGDLALAQKPGGGPGSSAPGAADPEATKKLREQSVNNLKNIALAAHSYSDAMGTLPNNVLDKEGKPLLSWRVQLLPYLEQGNLYTQFHLGEPWDSEHNLKLLAQMPDAYKTGVEGKGATNTYYQGFAAKSAFFPPGRTLRFPDDFPDGTTNTLMVVEAGAAVPWTKPADLPYAADKPLPKLGGPFGDLIHAVCADGTIRTLRKDFDEEQMRRAIVRDDGLAVEWEELEAAAPTRPKAEKPKPTADEELQKLRAEAKRLLYESQIRAAQAASTEERARAASQQAKEAELQRERAEVAQRQAEALAEQARADALVLKAENERLRAALREIAAQVQKLAPPEKEKRPADDVKSLAEEVEKTRAELRRLRDEVERLKKQIEK